MFEKKNENKVIFQDFVYYKIFKYHDKTPYWNIIFNLYKRKGIDDHQFLANFKTFF